jgi:hypothetical protein
VMQELRLREYVCLLLMVQNVMYRIICFLVWLTLFYCRRQKSVLEWMSACPMKGFSISIYQRCSRLCMLIGRIWSITGACAVSKCASATSTSYFFCPNTVQNLDASIRSSFQLCTFLQ